MENQISINKRKRRSETDKANKNINIRLKQEELDQLRMNADSEGKTLSFYILDKTLYKNNQRKEDEKIFNNVEKTDRDIILDLCGDCTCRLCERIRRILR